MAIEGTAREKAFERLGVPGIGGRAGRGAEGGGNDGPGTPRRTPRRDLDRARGLLQRYTWKQ